MKTALSISSPADWNNAKLTGADFCEIRIDLISNERDSRELIELCKNGLNIPIIATIRSFEEGGKFKGGDEDWRKIIEPWCCCADYIDIERKFSHFSKDIKETDTKIIASAHLNYMPDNNELLSIHRELKGYGDIPKIVVTPGSNEDLLSFIRFTIDAEKPVITSVMGEEFRWARVVLLLFGSMIVYCHSGEKAATGQYHISDMKKILEMII
ncbi:type I 3-dehydroquinate dehydratase [Methanochimaera problematica]|uniref:type I 3-dehydroquinate dehydratase n=1 Tax=Methanochimaera problematica TaxID=2609417 RepID=UPI002939176A|nr:type I 3-dehydroquinate dehydratase [Methanoplanus sp. FWC-SCC4]